jgi:glc operon protein GlcG
MTTTAARATHVRTQHTITYAGARAAVDAALERAAEIGVAVNVAVTDPSGALIAFARMDGAPLLSSGIAQDKAWTVSAFNGIATHEFFGLIENEAALREGIVHRDRLVVFGGGVPIRLDDILVGAVGVSGGTAEQDRVIAEAGAAALGSTT